MNKPTSYHQREPDGATHDVWQGDCLELLRRLEPEGVDLVFCSPPYEAQRTYGIGFDLKGQAWVDWAVERFEACYDACRGLTAWVVAGFTRDYRWSATPALLAADLHRRGVRLRNPPIYKRQSIPGSGGRDWLRSDYEWITCASGGRLPWSDNTAMGEPPKHKPGGRPSHRTKNGDRVGRKLKMPRSKLSSDRGGGVTNEGFYEWNYKPPAIANPGNVIDCRSAGGGQMGDPLAHENEAPFPESLAEFFIRSFCPPGGVVLDPFGGSGTTATVARRLGRSSISFDIRESQVDLMRRRLQQPRGKNASTARNY